MYEPMLDTFLAVADCGSFTKAAEQLFISPTAIMKQMNSLENSNYKLHLIPFEDDHNGILLEIEQLGEKFDFLIGVCDSQTWLSMCDFLSI